MGNVFTRVCLSVCLSVRLLTGLLKTTDQIFMKFYVMNLWLDTIHWPIDQILSDLDQGQGDCRGLKVKIILRTTPFKIVVERRDKK